MTPLGPFSQRDGTLPSSRPMTLGGRVQRDVRLQAALALLIGIALVAVPLFIWGRGKKKHGAEEAAAASASASEDAGAPTVVFGDAGAQVSVDAGGRLVTFGEPKYLKCQDTGPGKTSPDKCDHLGPIEEAVTKAIADRATTCLPALKQNAAINVIVDVSFKKKKFHLTAGKDGTTIPAAQRKKVLACIEKGMAAPSWDTLTHAHQRYVFQFLATLGAPPATAPSTLQ
jgi:hypothetical protein